MTQQSRSRVAGYRRDEAEARKGLVSSFDLETTQAE
jgi:hypothetical protein